MPARDGRVVKRDAARRVLAHEEHGLGSAEEESIHDGSFFEDLARNTKQVGECTPTRSTGFDAPRGRVSTTAPFVST